MNRKINIVRLSIAGLIGILLVIILNIKENENISLADFIPVFSVLLVFGIKEIQMYFNYKRSIKKGIDLISTHTIWSIDYMIINSDTEKDNQINVRNDLMWIDKGNKKNENIDMLLGMLISDFEDIAKDKRLKDFLKNKMVKFNLHSSDLKNDDLLKTEIKHYV